MKKTIILLMSILFSAIILGCSEDNIDKTDTKNPISINVNQTIELFSLIHHYVGDDQYNENMLPDYTKDITSFFNDFKKHKAILFARKCSTMNGINGDAPMALAVHIGPPPELKPNINLSGLPPDFDPRWDSSLIVQYLNHVRQFAIDSKFSEFFSKQKEFHEKTIDKLEKMLYKQEIISWMAEFFGVTHDKFTIHVSFLNGSCNYGYRVSFGDKAFESVCLLGAVEPHWWTGIPHYNEEKYLGVIIHEFTHSFINSLIKTNPNDWMALGDAILETHNEDTTDQGYNVWNVILSEYIVRAITIRYYKAKGGDKTAQKLIAKEKSYGFHNIEGLVELFNLFEEDRIQYPDLESFLPVIKQYFESTALELCKTKN